MVFTMTMLQRARAYVTVPLSSLRALYKEMTVPPGDARLGRNRYNSKERIQTSSAQVAAHIMKRLIETTKIPKALSVSWITMVLDVL